MKAFTELELKPGETVNITAENACFCNLIFHKNVTFYGKPGLLFEDPEGQRDGADCFVFFNISYIGSCRMWRVKKEGVTIGTE